jgi:hypothetical protein
MTTRNLREWTPENLKRVAAILGPSSAAAQALEAFEAREAAGQPSGIYEVTAGPERRGTLLVGPKLQAHGED